MPDPSTTHTDNAAVALLLMAHEIAKANAPPQPSDRDRGERFDADQYLRVFDKVYKGLSATATTPVSMA